MGLSCLLTPAASAVERGRLHSATHLGFATQQGSSMGHNGKAGSALLMDVGYAVHPSVIVGLRSTGMGADGEANNFYRVAAGGLAQIEVTDGWFADVSLSRFSESGLVNAQRYTSRGYAAMLAWERLSEITKQSHIAWGGFWQMHRGDVHTDDDAVPLSNSNDGQTRGIKIALRMLL